METNTPEMEYGLITKLPVSDADYCLEIEWHAQIYSENRDNPGYDAKRRAAIAYANLNQLLQREITEDALAEAQKCLGTFSVSNS